MALWNFWKNRRRREKDLDEELQAHFAMAVQERIERGEDAREAERAVRREFGNETLVREVTREMWGSALPGQLLQDLRYAVRRLRNRPGVTAVTVASLALGIGANLALFAIAYPIFFRPLAVYRPEELVELLQKYPGEPRGNGFWTSRSYEHYRDHNTVFDGLAGTSFDFATRLEITESAPATVLGEQVTPNYFAMLHLRPETGRLIGPEDIGTSVAVLSWEVWNSRFHRNPSVVNRTISVNGKPATVIGVAPADYTGPLANARTAVWTPVPPGAGLNLIGRLKPGVTIDQARSEMKVLYRFTIDERAESGDPQTKHLQVELEPARNGLVNLRDQVGRPLLILMGLVAVLLLLACVNVAGILLAQAANREHEMALRSGLGASRWRLVRQVLTESCLLSAGSALLGLVVAYAGTAALLGILDSGRAHERIRLLVTVDSTVALTALGITILTGVLFGSVPALHASETALRAALGQAAKGSPGRSQRRFGRMLASAQVALALLLSSIGARFLTNLSNLKAKDLGFRRDHILLATVEAGRSGYGGAKLANAIREILHRIRAVPGVASASIGGPTPLMGAGASGWLTAEGFEQPPGERRRIAISWVAPQYFSSLRIPILSGREFDVSDEAAAKGAILSESAARYFFPGQNPAGKHIVLDKVTMTKDPAAYTVIGVAGDANYREMRESDRRQVYLSAFGPGRITGRTLLVKTEGAPESLGPEVQRIVRNVAPGLGVRDIKSLSSQVDASIMPERLIAVLAGFFGAAGGLLAGIGLYGLLAYGVARRTKEIGVRMALGATRASILGTVLSEGLAITAAGVGAGIPLAWWMSELGTRLVPDLTAPPAAALTGGAAAIVITAAVASLLPAKRAMGVDPVQSLRHE